LHIVVSNTYCVVFLFCFSWSCVPYVASFSVCLFWLPLRYSLTFIYLSFVISFSWISDNSKFVNGPVNLEIMIFHCINLYNYRKQNKNTTEYVLEATICKQTQITLIRHAPSYKQLEELRQVSLTNVDANFCSPSCLKLLLSFCTYCGPVNLEIMIFHCINLYNYSAYHKNYTEGP
jgi:hypothetical protein